MIRASAGAEAARGRRWAALATAVLAVGLAVACTSPTSAPPVPSSAGGGTDPVLVTGREVWVRSCARCHGPRGTGGAGPRLTGVVVDKYPDPAAEATVIREGRRGMPAFGSSLSAEQIDAVVRYTREVLG